MHRRYAPIDFAKIEASVDNLPWWFEEDNLNVYSASDPGDAVLTFYQSDKTTSKAYVGFNSGASNTLSLVNEVQDANLNLGATHATHGTHTIFQHYPGTYQNKMRGARFFFRNQPAVDYGLKHLTTVQSAYTTANTNWQQLASTSGAAGRYGSAFIHVATTGGSMDAMNATFRVSGSWNSDVNDVSVVLVGVTGQGLQAALTDWRVRFDGSNTCYFDVRNSSPGLSNTTMHVTVEGANIQSPEGTSLGWIANFVNNPTTAGHTTASRTISSELNSWAKMHSGWANGTGGGGVYVVSDSLSTPNHGLMIRGDQRITYTGNTSTTASAGAQTLPSNPVGFIQTVINGTLRKVPYYAT